MDEALLLAAEAASHGEVPVGALVVYDGQIVGRGYDTRESTCDPVAHAEILAIREAAARLGKWRLSGCTLYVTLEPCSMCVGAIAQARVGRLVYGTDDPQGGAFSGGKATESTGGLEVVRDVLRQECEEVLKTFFSGLRSKT